MIKLNYKAHAYIPGVPGSVDRSGSIELEKVKNIIQVGTDKELKIILQNGSSIGANENCHITELSFE